MKIYTKTGDSGVTGLYDGNRAPKSSHIFGVLGASDELSSFIGLLCTDVPDDEQVFLRGLQRQLYKFNTIVATPNTDRRRVELFSEGEAKSLEDRIDELCSNTPPLRNFVLPGSGKADSYAHICRVKARNLEREVCIFKEGELQIAGLDDNVSKFLNRLSDYFFALARNLVFSNGLEEIKA